MIKSQKRQEARGRQWYVCVLRNWSFEPELVIGVAHQKQRERTKLHCEDTYNNRDALIRTKRSRQSDQRTKRIKTKTNLSLSSYMWPLLAMVWLLALCLQWG